MNAAQERNPISFSRREDHLEYLFHAKGPFWHLCTPGTNQEILFNQDEDYRFGVSSCALSLEGDVRVLALAVMSNHLHDILAGTEEACLRYFDRRRKILRTYLSTGDKRPDLSGFICKLLPIEDLKALRAEIVYVNRNGYVACPEHTPFSYPWSSGMYYFNPAAWGGGTSYANLPYRTKRLVTHSRICELPARYQVKDGALHIPSFASIKEGEDFFQDAHQYFNLLSRGREAYSEVAKRLGDEVFLTDNELFDAVCTLCRTRFDIAKPPQLGAEDKIQVALQMKQSWHASNGQIRRILKLDDRVVKELFP
jgi:hypothetical protein